MYGQERRQFIYRKKRYTDEGFFQICFPKGRDLSKLYIQFFIAAENGNETGTVNPIKISAEYGKRYTVVIEGNYKDGYAAKLNN